MKYYVVIFGLFICSLVNSQNTFPWVENGDIGIGTNTPNATLDVNGKILVERINIKNNRLPDGTIFSSTDEKNDKSALIAAGTDSDNTNLFTIFDFPQSNYNSKSEVWLNLDDRENKTRLRMRALTSGKTEFKLYNRFQSEIFTLEENNNLVELSLIKPNSHVMIGTSNYIDQNLNETYHLSVNGKVRAHGVRVYTDWADFVF